MRKNREKWKRENRKFENVKNDNFTCSSHMFEFYVDVKSRVGGCLFKGRWYKVGDGGDGLY